MEIPTLLYRLVHIDTLPTLLARKTLHAPNTTPNDGWIYRTIHDAGVQNHRRVTNIPCGPQGTLHDYVPFYFGPLSVMLLNHKSLRVQGSEGQEPLVYLCTSAQMVQQSGHRFVFSDGHGIVAYTRWFDDLACLHEVDWDIVGAQYWSNTPEDNDRKHRKQAEFLIWNSLDWSLIQSICVINGAMKERVKVILNQHPSTHHPEVFVKRTWYY